MAARIGLLRTFTDLPSNLLLAAIAFAPNWRPRPRSYSDASRSFSQMDVPRQAYVETVPL